MQQANPNSDTGVSGQSKPARAPCVSTSARVSNRYYGVFLTSIYSSVYIRTSNVLAKHPLQHNGCQLLHQCGPLFGLGPHLLLFSFCPHCDLAVQLAAQVKAANYGLHHRPFMAPAAEETPPYVCAAVMAFLRSIHPSMNSKSYRPSGARPFHSHE